VAASLLSKCGDLNRFFLFKSYLLNTVVQLHFLPSRLAVSSRRMRVLEASFLKTLHVNPKVVCLHCVQLLIRSSSGKSEV
jgi:hypothetical protein